MSYNLNDVTSAANNGMAKMEERAAHEIDRAKHGIDAARDATASTARDASSTLSTLMKGIATTVSVVSLLRQVDRGLGRIGLARRKSPFTSLAVFSAGVAMGAGVGVLFAPASGADTRRAIADRFNALLGRKPTSPTNGVDAAEITQSTPVARPATVVPHAPATVATNTHAATAGGGRSPLNNPT